MGRLGAIGTAVDAVQPDARATTGKPEHCTSPLAAKSDELGDAASLDDYGDKVTSVGPNLARDVTPPTVPHFGAKPASSWEPTLLHQQAVPGLTPNRRPAGLKAGGIDYQDAGMLTDNRPGQPGFTDPAVWLLEPR